MKGQKVFIVGLTILEVVCLILQRVSPDFGLHEVGVPYIYLLIGQDRLFYDPIIMVYFLAIEPLAVVHEDVVEWLQELDLLCEVCYA